jgi:HAD superfamily hydrolase (TIGR01509 family)
MIKAVIFDMDGLMIDSEPIHYQAYSRVLHDLGKKYPLEDNNRLYIGLSDSEQAKDMVVRYALPLSPEELVEKKQKEFKQIIQTAIIPKPGLMQLLEDLKSNQYKMAIASSSRKDVIELVIKSLKISHFISAYCSAEDVQNAKPAPDLFLLAADKLQVKPQECLVLEDSPRGIEAASKAGMKSFAIPSEETKNGDFTKSTEKLDNLNNVFARLSTV